MNWTPNLQVPARPFRELRGEHASDYAARAQPRARRIQGDEIAFGHNACIFVHLDATGPLKGRLGWRRNMAPAAE
eukprot:1009534-Pleurochrysis_carterae.AAC.1